MSDGPHRSLAMRSGWKKLAERADQQAYAIEEICEALPAALEQDWRAELSESLCQQVQIILDDTQGSLFGDERLDRLEALRSEAAGFPLANVLLDCAMQSVAKNDGGNHALEEAAYYALADRAMRGIRQVEEHYRRKSTGDRADSVRNRLEQGVARLDVGQIARRLTGLDRSPQARSIAKKSGLDDGVQL